MVEKSFPKFCILLMKNPSLRKSLIRLVLNPLPVTFHITLRYHALKATFFNSFEKNKNYIWVRRDTVNKRDIMRFKNGENYTRNKQIP